MKCPKCNSRYLTDWELEVHLKTEHSEVSSTALLSALEQIKYTALTTRNAIDGLGRIVRICIDAGVTKNIDEIKADNGPADWREKEE